AGSSSQSSLVICAMRAPQRSWRFQYCRFAWQPLLFRRGYFASFRFIFPSSTSASREFPARPERPSETKMRSTTQSLFFSPTHRRHRPSRVSLRSFFPKLRKCFARFGSIRLNSLAPTTFGGGDLLSEPVRQITLSSCLVLHNH